MVVLGRESYCRIMLKCIAEDVLSDMHFYFHSYKVTVPFNGRSTEDDPAKMIKSPGSTMN